MLLANASNSMQRTSHAVGTIDQIIDCYIQAAYQVVHDALMVVSKYCIDVVRMASVKEARQGVFESGTSN